ncbi:glycosyltransferase [Roseiconus lacunae]|uniref:glycosyltransferase n=1 Tax=Roseiconus lacunae TaxID=2605694 RepID=UPI0011F14FD1|nr:glycosyltransferase [Roseiconus lacunae]MCD0461926.1 hypothetical protein [Roseiconus lacunae]
MGPTRQPLRTEVISIDWVCSGLICVYLGLLMFKVIALARTMRRQSQCEIQRSDQVYEPAPELAERIVIVQPILGGDPRLEETLRYNVESLPTDVAFLWLVDEDDKIGSEVASNLAGSRTNIKVIVCPPAADDINPKTFKLGIALQLADRSLFAVLDDDTTIDISSLNAAAESLSEYGLYTGLPLYRPAEHLWGKLVTQFVNNNSVLTYLPLLNFADPMSINGMFYVVNTTAMKRHGGFSTIRHELCDDYAMKKLATNAGWKIRQGITYQFVSTSVETFGQYWGLMHRWFLFSLLLVKDQRRLVQAALVTLLGLPPILLLVASILAIVSVWGWSVWCAGLVIRHVLLAYSRKCARTPSVYFNPILSVVSELLQPIHMIHAVLSSKIQWRSRRIHVRSGMSFQVIEDWDR